MAALSSRDIERGLLRKGFRYRDGDHRFLSFFYREKETPVHTKLSHGVGDYGDALLSKVKKQLHLGSVVQLLELLQCSLTQEGYTQILREQGLVS